MYISELSSSKFILTSSIISFSLGFPSFFFRLGNLNYNILYNITGCYNCHQLLLYIITANLLPISGTTYRKLMSFDAGTVSVIIFLSRVSSSWFNTSLEISLGVTEISLTSKRCEPPKQPNQTHLGRFSTTFAETLTARTMVRELILQN